MFIHIYGEQRCMGAGLSSDADLALSHVKVFVAVSSLQTGTVTAGKAALVTGSSFDAQKPNKVGVQVSRQFHMPHTFSVCPAIKKLCFKRVCLMLLAVWAFRILTQNAAIRR